MGTAIRQMDPAENEFLAALEKKSGKPNRFYRTMANRPEVLKNFVPLYGAIVGPGLDFTDKAVKAYDLAHPVK